jgi:putative glutathione S-transferase
MGSLIDGQWVDRWRDTQSTGGRYVRPDAKIRNWITADGEPGPSGDGGFKAEAGRYHLYIASSCPWAHRTMIFRTLKGLEDMISFSVVNPIAHGEGWTFHDGHGVIPDPLFGVSYLYEIYQQADSNYTGLVTVPTLWDKQRSMIVSIRMFNCAFDGIGAAPGDYYSKELRAQINAINELVYHAINNGVYRTGFATSEDAYQEGYDRLFGALDKLEEILSTQSYLVDEKVTEADWRAFTTLIRFDLVYYGPLKCNKRRLIDYPNLWDYTRALYQVPGVAETVDPFAIKQHYYASSKMLQPTGIVGLGPDIDFDAPSIRRQS